MKKVFKVMIMILLVCFTAIPASVSGETFKNSAGEESSLGSNYTIAYQCYSNKGSGWGEWAADNNEVNAGDGKDIGAIKVKLNPEIEKQGVNVTYRVYLEDIGWQKWVMNGEETGACDKYRVEAIQVKIVNADGSYNREYSAAYDSSVNCLGWQNKTRYDGETSGTTDKCVGLNAFKIKVSNETFYPIVKCWTLYCGECAECVNGAFDGQHVYDPIGTISIKLPEEYANKGYLIAYRVLQNNHDDWSEWVQDGALAGETPGNRWDAGDWIQAIQVKIVDKSGNTEKTCNVRYLSQIGDRGIESIIKHDGKASGTADVDEPLRIETIKMDCKLWSANN